MFSYIKAMWFIKYNLNVLFLDHNKPFELNTCQLRDYIITYLLTYVVYFDQRLGAAHSKRWSK